MEEAKEMIRATRKAIGKNDPSEDWKIVPTEHAEMYEDTAPPLAEVLRGARPGGLAKMYEDLNDRAVKARNNFKSTVVRADAAVFSTASLAALLLIAGGLQELLAGAGPWVVKIIGILGVVSVGLATMWLNQVSGGDLIKKWVNERAKAEGKRLTYFKAIMDGVSDEPSDQLLAFEYTRRFLLDNQIDYFRERGIEHGDAADIALKTSTRAVFLASTFTAVAGFLAWLEPQLAVIAGLGVIASAYATLAVSRSLVNLDRKNADRYRTAEDQLKERKLDIDTFREKIASGEKGAVKKFFEPIFVTLVADHKEFLAGAELNESAIGNMEERLRAAREPFDSDQSQDSGK